MIQLEEDILYVRGWEVRKDENNGNWTWERLELSLSNAQGGYIFFSILSCHFLSLLVSY